VYDLWFAPVISKDPTQFFAALHLWNHLYVTLLKPEISVGQTKVIDRPICTSPLTVGVGGIGISSRVGVGVGVGVGVRVGVGVGVRVGVGTGVGVETKALVRQSVLAVRA
jgi:hypothetical protein